MPRGVRSSTASGLAAAPTGRLRRVAAKANRARPSGAAFTAALLIGLALLRAPALASAGADLAQDFPPGSITTAETVRLALEASRALEQRSQSDWEAAQARCAAQFFANRCLEAAKRERTAALAQARRVRVEANAVQRRLDAEQRASERAARALADEAAREPRPSAGSGPALPARSPEEIERARQRHTELESAQRQRQADEAARAPQRAEQAQRFEERQRDAAAHAKAKEQERLEHEKQRAERAAARARDAQRKAAPAGAAGAAAADPQIGPPK